MRVWAHGAPGSHGPGFVLLVPNNKAPEAEIPSCLRIEEENFWLTKANNAFEASVLLLALYNQSIKTGVLYPGKTLLRAVEGKSGIIYVIEFMRRA